MLYQVFYIYRGQQKTVKVVERSENTCLDHSTGKQSSLVTADSITIKYERGVLEKAQTFTSKDGRGSTTSGTFVNAQLLDSTPNIIKGNTENLCM